MRSLLALALLINALLVTMAVPPVRAADSLTPPWVGVWDCEVATFTFTPTHYDAGEGPMPIRAATVDDGVWTLSFDDDYRINLSAVTKTTMEWLSQASGDGFSCKRLS
ncbi:hypothetical protein SAMN05880582_1011007 [Rhizobium sp. RU20A]|uniref:hypothetical protein n=1 Tax=Rhizobium sp. RU20A TaxID=1907412 RepID=UPI00095442F8|nr:hypothetical protein [Rhizobium sp. RU20A]SIQ17620.1 hypothetical protein SAMN05880582_1011007 [Rhizobium sp. RU20A]